MNYFSLRKFSVCYDFKMLQYSVRSVHLYSTYALYTPLLHLRSAVTFTRSTLCTPLLDVRSVHLYLTYTQYTLLDVRSVHLYSTYALYPFNWRTLCSNLYSTYALYTFAWRTLCTPLLDVRSVHLYLTYALYTFIRRMLCAPLFNIIGYFCAWASNNQFSFITTICNNCQSVPLM